MSARSSSPQGEMRLDTQYYSEQQILIEQSTGGDIVEPEIKASALAWVPNAMRFSGAVSVETYEVADADDDDAAAGGFDAGHPASDETEAAAEIVALMIAIGIATSAIAGLPPIIFGGSRAPLPTSLHDLPSLRAHAILAILLIGMVACSK